MQPDIRHVTTSTPRRTLAFHRDRLVAAMVHTALVQMNATPTLAFLNRKHTPIVLPSDCFTHNTTKSVTHMFPNFHTIPQLDLDAWTSERRAVVMDWNVQRGGTANLTLIVVPTTTFIALTMLLVMEAACQTVKPVATMAFIALLATTATEIIVVLWDQQPIAFRPW